MNQQDYQSPNWQAGETRLVCVERWQETHDVTSFRFQGAQPVKFHFKPGQFITFLLDIQGERLARSYTISSSPSRPYSLVVTIKRIPGGRVSNYLVDNLKTGHSVNVSGPAGAFNLIDIPASRYLFLSAGSGITPMYSMSRWLTDTQVGSDIAFVHSAKAKEDLIFHDALLKMTQRHPNMALHYSLESGESLEACPSFEGRLTLEMLAKAVPDYLERTVFVCGPEPYMQAVKGMLEGVGFDMSRYHQESFGGPSTASSLQAEGQGDIAASAPFMLQVGDLSTQLTGEQTVLEGIEAKGLPIIAACRSGVCGACKCQVLSGETESSSEMTLTPAEVEQGFILACSTRLKSDVTLSLA
ncbi:2Fe-2S iron-sulfur cluster binding domain-containing protein [Shewanella sp. JBTF-M18]|uniref:2Fe-2S iron-sulfur cluster binding domain-containing protein n=1 Tax=Shewanella insulae TaxID=2681496 RepID=A0A6L7HUR5_9GAMM|nr:hybrid-cluster NAD(P)-dependent oxidoreductase [Shewanella insulae]MXR68057.1 2Fe-2S iron-sulfur cluster binding domain-containing protein [Shewanella insulae]